MASTVITRGFRALNGWTVMMPLSIGTRAISGKALRMREPRPKPFNQDKYDYTALWSVLDKTTLRFDENSKLVVVEGAHAVGKTAFAKELAEELDMLYVPNPTVTSLAVNSYGDDLRNYKEYLTPHNWIFDETDFSRNPMGVVEGSCDRLHLRLYYEKFRAHLYALKHIFNTGQGVVMEGSPASFYAYVDAAFNQGWIERETREFFKLMARRSLHTLLRPNLIIYLDAHVDVVQSNIKARGNEWDKDSPVWTNKQYLNDIYNELKRNYLREQQNHSRVLVYDWTQPGDTEIVVEDIEAINFDLLDKYDTQQKDWRLRDEAGYSNKRAEYCNRYERTKLLKNLTGFIYFDAKHAFMDPMDVVNRDNLMNMLKSERFSYGFNEAMGDKSVMFRGLPTPAEMDKDSRYYSTYGCPRFITLFNDFKGILHEDAAGNANQSEAKK